ncbi:MAG: hypothetical protein MJY63_02345 [Paludibacteraceae bacterium]|nr:hypothetical protein [Paludibacteraceae bacterium]
MFEVIKNALCPLFLIHAAVLLVLGIKAAFLTHGFHRIDLLIYLICVTLAGAYFAADLGVEAIAVNSVFNLVFSACMLYYLGADLKWTTILSIPFCLVTAGLAYVM